MENYKQKYEEVVKEISKLRDMLLEEEVIHIGGIIDDNFKRIFPELEESEDERIRKEMIFYFTEEIPQCSIQEHSDKMREFISWLKRQKSIEWSDEDESALKTIINELEANKSESKDYEHKTYDKLIGWLISLKPQPKQEWSDEDEKMLISIIYDFGLGRMSSTRQDLWLKSLKERIRL